MFTRDTGLSIELYKKARQSRQLLVFCLPARGQNLPFTVLMFGFFGIKALYIIISAIVIAITTGLIFQILEKNKMIEENKNIVSIDENFSIREDIKKRMREYRFGVKQLKDDIYGIFSGSVALGNMILWWVLIGMGIASLTAAYIPHNIFHKYMGPSATGIFMTLIVATLLEICSEGTAPLAFEIFRQTGALGNSFIFLMAGVVTDYTEIGLLWSNIGRKTAIWLPIITVPQVILFGILANMLF